MAGSFGNHSNNTGSISVIFIGVSGYWCEIAISLQVSSLGRCSFYDSVCPARREIRIRLDQYAGDTFLPQRTNGIIEQRSYWLQKQLDLQSMVLPSYCYLGQPYTLNRSSRVGSSVI